MVNSNSPVSVTMGFRPLL